MEPKKANTVPKITYKRIHWWEFIYLWQKKIDIICFIDLQKYSILFWKKQIKQKTVP